MEAEITLDFENLNLSERRRKAEEHEADQKRKKKELYRQFHEKISDQEIHACTKRFKSLVDTALAAFSNADVTNQDAEDSTLYLEEHQLKNIAKEAAKVKNKKFAKLTSFEMGETNFPPCQNWLGDEKKF